MKSIFDDIQSDIQCIYISTKYHWKWKSTIMPQQKLLDVLLSYMLQV